VIISIHQPAYLPWLGYFDKIINSDIFIILDTVDFQKNSFQNRNKILTKNGSIWLTVPIKKNKENKIIKNIKISYSKNWQKKHLDSIIFNYSKSINFEKNISKITYFYKNHWELFNDYCFEMLSVFCEILSIKNKIIRLSEDTKIDGIKSELILNICKKYNAKTYYSGVNGKIYLNEEKFKENNIKIFYQNYISPEYKQINSKLFQPNLSIIDYIMNSENLLSK